MRFLILTQYYPPEIGAPQLRLPAMVRELRALGHDVEVVTAMPNHPTGRVLPEYRGRFYMREEIEGVTRHRVWLYAATGSGMRRMISYLSFTLTSLVGLFRATRPDYIFVESPPLFLSIPGYVFGRLRGAKMIFNVADLWPDSVRELGIMKEGWMLSLAEKLEGWSYRVSHRVNAVTEGIRSTLLNQKKLPASKVLYLPNGADTEVFKPKPRELTLAKNLGLEEEKVVLYAGTLGYAQGLETVLEAARHLADRRDIRFIFIGDGPEKPRLLEISRTQNLTNVRFLDPAPPQYVADLFSLSIAGLVVLRDIPLFQGARPSKILTALSSGVPVLYSGVGEGARLVEEAEAGLVVPPENPRALAEAVRRLADDPALTKRLGQNGRIFIEENSNWSALVRNWIEALMRHESRQNSKPD